MNSGVYKIENTVNGQVYIGSSVDVGKRMVRHRDTLGKGNASKCLQLAWNYYGENSFIFVPLLYCNREFLVKWEQIAINGHINTLGWENMYNVRKKAQSTLGVKATEEKKLYMSKFTSERYSKLSKQERSIIAQKAVETKRKLGKLKQSKETVAKRVATRKARDNYKHSEESKQKQRGKFVSEETRRKQSLAKKGKTQTDEHKINSVAGRRRKAEEHGYWHSPTTKEHMSIAANKLAESREYTAEQKAELISRFKNTHTPEAIQKGMETRRRNGTLGNNQFTVANKETNDK